LAHNVESLAFRDFAFALGNKMTEIAAWAVLLDKVNVIWGLNDVKTLDNVGMIKILMDADLFSEEIQQESFDFGEI
jgi:hypothetical protein